MVAFDVNLSSEFVSCAGSRFSTVDEERFVSISAEELEKQSTKSRELQRRFLQSARLRGHLSLVRRLSADTAETPPDRHHKQGLELKPHTQSHVEGQAVALAQRGQVYLRLQKVGIVCPKIQLPELIGQQHLSAIRYIEEVSNKAELHLFT